MEADILEVLLRESQPVAGVGEENVAAVLVHGHVGVLAALEVGQLRGVVAVDPAGLVDRDRLPAARGVVLVLQTVLDDLELERAHRADDLAAVERRSEELRDAFVHELIDAFGQLFELQWIGILDITELFGCEGGNACEFELFAFGEGVADLEVARVVQADDVARVGEVDDRLFLGHESRRRGEFHLFAAAHVQEILVTFERAGADLQEGDAVAVVRIHVGVDLEDEACHFLLGRLHDPGFGRRRARRGGDADETLQQLLHAEIIDRRAEEDRGQLSPQVSVAVESVVHAFDQFGVFAQLLGVAFGDVFVQFGRGEVVDLYGRSVGRLPFVARKEREVLLVDVVNALEGVAARNRKRQGTYPDAEFLLDFVQQVEGILAGAVELVYEDDHRGLPHAADVHQLAGLGLDAFGAVDDDDYGVHGRQRAVGIFGEVFVARGIENVDLAALVFETHDGRSDRNTALTFDLHEVGGGSLLDFIAFDRSRDVDGAAEEQQFFGQGRFTGVRVRDDGERPPAGDLFL